MSFYGNVYYQFIDTFYKAIAKNTVKGYNLPTEVQTDVELPIDAIGRQGIFHLTNGNDWIKFKKEDDITFSIWHDKPDESYQGTSFLYGINIPEIGDGKDYVDNKAFDDAWQPVQLNPGDAFTTCGYYCDEAGHIMYNAKGNAAKYQKAFRLPRYDELDELTDLEALVGMNEDGEPIDKNGVVISDAFKEATISETVINNQTNINNNTIQLENLSKTYNEVYNDRTGDYSSSPSYFFGNKPYKEDGKTRKNFPQHFGNVNNILDRWGNLLTSNADIKKYITVDEKDIYKDYYSEAGNGALEIKDISSTLCLAEGALKAIQNISIKNVLDTAENARSAAIAAAQAVEQEIFNAENTVPEAFGKNGSKCYFNQDNSVADAFGLADDKETCYFKSGNSVRNTIENLDSKINTKVDNNIFDEYKTTIYTQTETDALLSTKVNNDTLNNYYNKDYIDGIIKSLQDEISTLKNKINTLESYHSNENVENPEDEEIIPEE